MEAERKVGLWIDDPVRRRGRHAQPHAGAVGVALASAVVEAVERRGRELRGERRRRGDARRRQIELTDLDRRLVTELVYGSVRRMRAIDFIIDKLATKKSSQQPPELRTILHLGLYQLQYLNNIPPSAAAIYQTNSCGTGILPVN